MKQKYSALQLRNVILYFLLEILYQKLKKKNTSMFHKFP